MTVTTAQRSFNEQVAKALEVAMRTDLSPRIPNRHLRIAKTYKLAPGDVLLDWDTHEPYGIVTSVSRKERTYTYTARDGATVSGPIVPKYNNIKRFAREGE